MMAVESTVFPLPSEVVIPPAAFWAAQGKMNFWAVVFAGMGGSYFGSVISYFVSRKAGRFLILRYGRYFFIPKEKFLLAESWLNQYSAGGVFFARLLPVVRHLVSIPAGVVRMPFGRFSLMTLTGSFLWCAVLAWFGQRVIGDQPDLMSNPAALVRVCKERLSWFLVAALVLAILYFIVQRFRVSSKAQSSVPGDPYSAKPKEWELGTDR